ncbi:MAG: hypothetical protein ACKO96_16615, partial [Flammeovirgaceae bacterium]
PTLTTFSSKREGEPHWGAYGLDLHYQHFFFKNIKLSATFSVAANQIQASKHVHPTAKFNIHDVLNNINQDGQIWAVS